jgi:hypothetical protein
MVDSLTSDPVAFVLKRPSREAEIADRSLWEDFRKNATTRDPWTAVLEEEAHYIGKVVSGCWWKKQKASSSSEFAKRLALAGRRVKEDDAHGKG